MANYDYNGRLSSRDGKKRLQQVHCLALYKGLQKFGTLEKVNSKKILI